ncbi:MAG: RagB/SusD family nutrient uptake outer membrane protein [Bacteroidaceae bacterium]|nr:RagB/SusD family nutrient uptake outer membrane protein [Bacteroidaceae bacterium]
MKTYLKYILPAVAIAACVGLTSCTGDLDITPIDPNLNTELDADALFNKCYATMAMNGMSDTDADVDVQNIDGGTQGFMRQIWNANELTTDEAICWWGDDGVAEFCYNTYDATHPMLQGLYYRLYFGVTICNHYLEVASSVDATRTAEIRFLRALYYYYLMDLYANIPFTLAVSSEKAPQWKRAEVFNWLVGELKEIEPLLSDAKAKTSADANYGRADKAAAWMLLARLYLNAKVYTGTPAWEEAATWAKKVIDSDYKLHKTGRNGWSAYQMLFMGDNGQSDAAKEAVFVILQDGLKTTSYGGSTFLTQSTFDTDMVMTASGATNGLANQWRGNRARPQLVQKFFPNLDIPTEAAGLKTAEAAALAGDNRALFWSKGRTLDCGDNSDFAQGISVAKFTNLYSSDANGAGGQHTTFSDADIFFMRVAEAYLTYAEALVRQGKAADALPYVNELRARANAAAKGSVTLNDILDEWSREFYFEGRRRIDLIRFDRFGGQSEYNWQYKGGTFAGRQFSADRNIFAIPATDRNANPNLKQNDGY